MIEVRDGEIQNEPARITYEIKLRGQLNESWADWFEGLTFTHESDGMTTLSGKIIDQAALHDILANICDPKLKLFSVKQIDTE